MELFMNGNSDLQIIRKILEWVICGLQTTGLVYIGIWAHRKNAPSKKQKIIEDEKDKKKTSTSDIFNYCC